MSADLFYLRRGSLYVKSDFSMTLHKELAQMFTLNYCRAFDHVPNYWYEPVDINSVVLWTCPGCLDSFDALRTFEPDGCRFVINPCDNCSDNDSVLFELQLSLYPVCLDANGEKIEEHDNDS